jgi:hypothetical protein
MISFDLPDSANAGVSIQLEASSSSGLEVDFLIDTNTGAILNDDILNLGEPGTVEITAIQNGSELYESASSITRTLSVVSTVSAIDKLPNLKIHPNPATLELIIELPNHHLESIKMIDLSGKVWNDQATKVNSGKVTIDVGDLPDGLYVLRLETTSGERTTRKVLIQR